MTEPYAGMSRYVSSDVNWKLFASFAVATLAVIKVGQVVKVIVYRGKQIACVAELK